MAILTAEEYFRQERIRLQVKLLYYDALLGGENGKQLEPPKVDAIAHRRGRTVLTVEARSIDPAKPKPDSG